MTVYNLDIKDKKLFPNFTQLPYDNDYDVTFYKEDAESGILRPRHHWCFLVEITEIVPWLRPMYYAKDIDGQSVFIAFHTDDRSPHIARECKVGDTMAIMYAQSHAFMDGKIGIRVESHDYVKLLHCSLEKVLDVGEALISKSCHVCDKPAKSQCVNCAMKYCNKECQTADWKLRHKEECNIIGRCFLRWRCFDWWKFEFFRTP
ncbi:hypothetical protein AGABI1DRAFT_122698 [Agaricus bisporus var. burnettii JB137-S8]|uniref:MYND-type domain-containing protein n=1 Tax=Agaricus bisporus var. burnettii (strain JB137-S8 / ATCC MYA-4627 / FGSC 10392) TaxID=597362 RepID=K5WZM8_AGABU|nr:uncharacterized protein AGABI1DRAFT_122698 [Agaricus bisporus var. burnettii JB137-S8]EKM76298.1 hypothetical protein AGABI1DRAFT_122698 [Agaricus bisporus var. burnettii JB137-S8]